MSTLQLDLLDWLKSQAIPADSEPSAPVLLHRIDPVQNMARFYVLLVTRDLFGNWCLQRRWGRIGSRRGQTRLDPYPDIAAARVALDKLRTAKRRRGYQ